MITLIVIGLVILGALIAPYWLLPSFGIWIFSAWLSSNAGPLDVDNLCSVLFFIAVIGIILQIIIG